MRGHFTSPFTSNWIVSIAQFVEWNENTNCEKLHTISLCCNFKKLSQSAFAIVVKCASSSANKRLHEKISSIKLLITKLIFTFFSGSHLSNVDKKGPTCHNPWTSPSRDECCASQEHCNQTYFMSKISIKDQISGIRNVRVTSPGSHLGQKNLVIGSRGKTHGKPIYRQ